MNIIIYNASMAYLAQSTYLSISNILILKKNTKDSRSDSKYQIIIIRIWMSVREVYHFQR